MGPRGSRALLLALLVLTAVAGCREEEQERPLAYEAGHYQGKPDTALPQSTVDALRQRAQRQHDN